MWNLAHPTASTAAFEAVARAAQDRLRSRQDLGFLRLPDEAWHWEKSEAQAKELRRHSRHLVVLGMGGSSLGGRALLSALRRYEAGPQVSFLDNVDADTFWKWLRTQADPGGIEWVLVSKSGNTVETLTMADFVDQHLRTSGYKRLASQCTVISEVRDNPLTRWAYREQVPVLEIPQDVGGRFSVFSPVGLLPAAFYGLNLQHLREGAQWALSAHDLVTQLAAQTLASYGRQEWITLFWPYCDGLKEWGLWTEQLWAESLGKAKGRQGGPATRASTPWSLIGASDQHSVLQQVMEGARDKFVWFLRVQKSESEGPTLEKTLFDGQDLLLGRTMGELLAAEADATREALRQNQVSSLTLQTDELNEFNVGALLMLMELVVGTIGEALDINAFDQPGVELGKRLARQYLQR